MSLHINDDFSLPALLNSADLPWAPSPQAGVERRMLERIGDEVARATSLVRYGPRSRFPAHRHDLGEEFLVLDGVFSDEHGDYPTGTYVRNPPGTSHAPHTELGCTIFVKLRQMLAEEQTRLVVPYQPGWRGETLADGRERRLLHACAFGREVVAMERVPAGWIEPAMLAPHGVEALILEGSLYLHGSVWPQGSWLRLPAGSISRLHSPEGATYWVKRGHL